MGAPSAFEAVVLVRTDHLAFGVFALDSVLEEYSAFAGRSSGSFAASVAAAAFDTSSAATDPCSVEVVYPFEVHLVGTSEEAAASLEDAAFVELTCQLVVARSFDWGEA